MKRHSLSAYLSLPVLVLFWTLNATPNIYAQGGSGQLPGAKPTPTPAPKGGTRVNRSSAGTAENPTIAFNREITDRLDAKSSAKMPSGNLFFEEFMINAKSSDQLTFRIESEAPGIALQVFDKDKTEIAVAKDLSTGNYRFSTSSGGLPADGEYKLRVTGSLMGMASVPFSLTVNHIGLIPAVYNERLQGIYNNYRESDPNSVNETITKLEELTREDAGKPGAFEFLGVIYLYGRRDFAKAGTAMEQAIKTNGAAIVKITFDSQWRRMAKLKSGNFEWQEPRTGWLRIRYGQIILTDLANKPLASLKGAQIREIAKILTSTNQLIAMTAEGVRRPFVFLPGSKDLAEADLVMKLIQTHVMGK
ncbi:MAG: hypothetical protein L0220_19000 [Acidobacteria bacterium]|nr:hypothetical protein [Acidobacteriota bacterium]